MTILTNTKLGEQAQTTRSTYDTALTVLECMSEELAHWSICSSCSKLSPNGETHRAARLVVNH